MNYIGIDIGSTASKVVVRGSKEAYFVLPTGWSSKETAQTIRGRLREMEINVEDEATKVVATGYGRIVVDYADPDNHGDYLSWAGRPGTGRRKLYDH